MYLNHFNLSEQPFSITPDPRFLYMSTRHREALAHLLYGLGEGGGFVQLTGEVGTGKTTICRCLMEQVPDDVDIAVVLNPKVTAIELIATVCDELGIDYDADASIKTMIDVLNRYLLDAYARDRRTVLIIDEAQNLSADVLEQVRLLTNLETSTQKLLQIILIGQPELRDMLGREEMRQLAQRVTARYHLDPISREEANAYIQHRLQICGCSRNLFTEKAVDRIQKLTHGIPRLINVLCDRALLGAYVEGKPGVDHEIVSKASREVLAGAQGEPARSRSWWAAALLLLAGLLGGLLNAYQEPVRQWLVSSGVPGPFAQAPAPVPVPVQETSLDQAVEPEEQEVEPVVEFTEMPAAAGDATDDVAETATTAATTGDTGAAGTETAGTETAGTETAGTPDAAEPPLLDRLLVDADSSWYRAAWRELFAAWGVELPDAVKPDFCDHAAGYGLYCVLGRGDWDTLRAYDRPAVLTLKKEDGTLAQVYLSALDSTVAGLTIAGESHEIPVEQVARYWYGKYVLFGQAAPGGHLYLKQGVRNNDVAWLRSQFEKVRGVRLPTEDPPFFDAVLHHHIVEFQTEHGLLADGIVGRNTMLRLNSYFRRPDTPRLTGARW